MCIRWCPRGDLGTARTKRSTSGAPRDPVPQQAGPVLERLDRAAAGATADVVEERGKQSFPASDPPANW
jgi:hypothetical protein